MSSDQPSRNGSSHSADTLIPLVYSELRQLARAKLRDDRANQSLDATGLVHEAFLRLSAKPDCQWNNRGHFFAAAGEAMRRILIEKARSRQALKRGGGLQKQELLGDGIGIDQPERWLELDEALQALEARDDRKANLVKLRFFVGLSNEEVARALDIHPATVARDWAYARAWLKRHMDTER